jgi:hypothetical protein
MAAPLLPKTAILRNKYVDMAVLAYNVITDDDKNGCRIWWRFLGDNDETEEYYDNNFEIEIVDDAGRHTEAAPKIGPASVGWETKFSGDLKDHKDYGFRVNVGSLTSMWFGFYDQNEAVMSGIRDKSCAAHYSIYLRMYERAVFCVGTNPKCLCSLQATNYGLKVGEKKSHTCDLPRMYALPLAQLCDNSLVYHYPECVAKDTAVLAEVKRLRVQYLYP